ncbi:serine/threonine-protein phosphatase 6 regulatory subunit 1-like [Lepisosteus oculatus]|uniref:serine/threonine-protein phosphatase 6 regulatory subunit 1-like n=1 Tax=Lepisosteus oculatus TaxID=7918 RepID=UPI003722065B
MFWKFELSSVSQLDTILSRDDVTLSEVLDEDDVLQECKVNNRRLLQFLILPHNMRALVSHVTQEPPAELEERVRYKYSNVSCEVLTSDVSQITDALGDSEPLLSQLYSFLRPEGAAASGLNPLLASFFSRVMGLLISRKTERIVSFLRQKEGFIDLLLRHIGTSAIMDLLLRLLTCVEQPELRQEILTWLIEERIVHRLIDMIHPSKEEEQHCNGSSSLYDIIRLNRDQLIHIQLSPEHSLLLRELERQETVEHLLSNMFDSAPNESVLINGIQVVLTLMEPPRPRPELGGAVGVGGFFSLDGQLEVCPSGPDPASQLQSMLGTLRAVAKRLGDFERLLLQPLQRPPIQMTCALLDPPLGNLRLLVVKLVNCILQAGHWETLQTLLRHRLIETVLDLFFQFSFNNFLHTQVEQCVRLALSCPPPAGEGEEKGEPPTDPPTAPQEGPPAAHDNPLVRHLLVGCRLAQRILGAWEDNAREQSEGGRRRGYMGHLTRIANHVTQSSEKGPNQGVTCDIIRGLPEPDRQRWEQFVSGPLAEINKRNTVELDSVQLLHSSSDDEDSELKEFGFPQETVLQQAFVEYQIQQMTPNFVDHFGFNDEEFGEEEENVNAPFDKASSIAFLLDTDSESSQSTLFELCCKEKIQQFDDDGEDDEDGEEDSWADAEPRVSSGTVPNSCRTSDSTDSRGSADSEEEEEERGGGEEEPRAAGRGGQQSRDSGEGWAADLSFLAVADSGSSGWGEQCRQGEGGNWEVFSEDEPAAGPQSSAEAAGPAAPRADAGPPALEEEVTSPPGSQLPSAPSAAPPAASEGNGGPAPACAGGGAQGRGGPSKTRPGSAGAGEGRRAGKGGAEGPGGAGAPSPGARPAVPCCSSQAVPTATSVPPAVGGSLQDPLAPPRASDAAGNAQPSEVMPQGHSLPPTPPQSPAT